MPYPLSPPLPHPPDGQQHPCRPQTRRLLAFSSLLLFPFLGALLWLKPLQRIPQLAAMFDKLAVLPAPHLTERATRVAAYNDGIFNPMRQEDPGSPVSPDGKWVLEQGYMDTTAVTTDGKGSITRKVDTGLFRSSASNPLWLPDSRRWVELMAGEHGLYPVVLFVDSDRTLCEASIGFPRGTITWPDLMSPTLLGFVAPGRVLCTVNGDHHPRHHRPRKLPFFQFNLASTQSDLSEYLISLPPAMEKAEVTLSPDGRRLAWLLYTTSDDDGTSIIRSMVMLTLPDGNDRQMLGTLDSGEGIPHRLRWLPDSRHLTFVYRHGVWSLPVPVARS